MAGGAYPAVFEHAFGAATVERRPRRVACAGLLEHDTLLALGVVPVAIKGWFQQLPYATGPWARHLLGEARPASLAGSEIRFERLLDLEPDLILAINTHLVQEEYDRLAAIAPTIAWQKPDGPWGTHWEKNARIIGRALDESERIEGLIAGVYDSFRNARRRYPELVGARGISANSAGNVFVIRGPHYDVGSLLTGLGLVYPQAILDRIGTRTVSHFSWERTDLLSGLDVIVWDVHGDGNVPAMRRRLDELDVYPGQNRIVFNRADDPVAMATASQSVLSFPYAVELLAPRLAAAMAGVRSAP